MLRGWTAGLAAARARDQASAEPPSGWRWAGFTAVGVAAYAVALVASLPARLMLDLGPGWVASGTVWRGEAVLDGAWRLQWSVAPLRSLANLAFSADVEVTGVDTDLIGTMQAWPGHRLFEGLAGRADGGLIATLAPALPLRCASALQIDLKRLLVAGSDSGAVGEMRAEAPQCGSRTGTTTATLPSLAVSARRDGDATRIEVSPAGPVRHVWIEGRIAGGRLRLTPTPEGVRAQPLLQAAAMDEAL